MPKGVLTLLHPDDALALPRDPEHSLADMYGITAREIVEDYNDGRWDKHWIQQWVLNNPFSKGALRPYVPGNAYDEQNKVGWARWTQGAAIYLPPGGPRPALVKRAGLSAKAWGTIAVIVIGGLYAASGGHK